MSRRALARAKSATPAAPIRAASEDVGNIVVMTDADGVVARRNEFNLDRRTVTFTPRNAAASTYRYDAAGDTYDEAIATAGQAVTGFDDDDTHQARLPFPFPFYGKSYSEVFVNSDGNLTFEAGDNASTDRSIGRLVAGPPRIAGLFRDLDPSKGGGAVRIASEGGRFVVSWVQTPEYADFGTGPRQTFQIRLFPDGKIEFAYAGIDTDEAVVGIGQGGLKGSSSIVSFATGASGEYSSTIAERFTAVLEIDVTTAAQKFYETHDDAYDYLVFYNNLNVPAASGAVAWETTVRNHRTGYGDALIDVGASYGSASRLQAVINMGPLNQYPADPSGIVSKRFAARDTPLTVLAHEVGHLFLAFASIRDPHDPMARPMLDQQGHWNFGFNSEASLMEGNRIEDRGPGVSPRFRTVATVEGFSPLDQYLMGLRPAEEVPPTFLARTWTFWRMPQAGVEFDGQRRDVTVQDLILAEGRRTPDHTVSQRRFRFAVVFVVADGVQPTPAELAQVERYRTEFEQFFAKVTGDRAAADTSLRKSLTLSVYPARGLVQGQRSQATVSIARPAEADVVIALGAQAGNTSVPGSVRIPAGATSASFELTALRNGIDEIRAEPLDTAYDIAVAKVQVNPASALRIAVVSGDRQIIGGGAALPEPVVIRVTDENGLPYPGVTLTVSTSGGGAVLPATPVTDPTGQATLRWTPGAGPSAQLFVTLAGVSNSPSALVIAARPGTVTVSSVLNAASFDTSLAPGAFGSLYGSNLSTGGSLSASSPWPDSLAGVRVLVNGRSVPVLFVSERQVNFMLPSDMPAGTADLVVATSLASSAPYRITLRAVAPGIFFDPVTGHGAILNANTAFTTFVRPAMPGGFIEVYCTGLGPVSEPRPSSLRETIARTEVTINGSPAPVQFSGLAPGSPGLYQVNARVPEGLSSGVYDLSVTVNGVRSNTVRLAVR